MTPPFLPGEVALLRAINGAHSPFWDAAMFLISNVGAWTFPAIALLIFLFYRRPKSEAILLLLMVGAVCGGGRCPKLDAGEALLLSVYVPRIHLGCRRACTMSMATTGSSMASSLGTRRTILRWLPSSA